MAIINRGTLQQKITDFINRVSPFTAPLIQKSEDLEVRTDVLDSVIFRIPTIGSISSPAATFTADFATNDEININSAASIAASFNVTLANLRGNSIGKLNITKKINDVFNFANGQIIPYDTVGGQSGKTVLNLLVINTDTGYFVIPAYNVRIPTESVSLTAGSANTNLTAGSVLRSSGGVCQMRGSFTFGDLGGTNTITNIANPLFRPTENTLYKLSLKTFVVGQIGATVLIKTNGDVIWINGQFSVGHDLGSIMFINGN